MTSPDRFENKVVFVTGAARGQGRAEAVRFASEGADVIAIDACTEFASTAYPGATRDDLAETVRLVESRGRRIVAAAADVRDFDGLSRALADGIEQLGRLDVVIANAGICSGALSWEITAEQWQETVDVNLTGTFHTAKAAVPYLIEQGEGGAVVFTSSVSGLKGTPFTGHYVATKHGITGLAKTMANELGEHRIRVNTVHPAGVDTGMKVRDLHPLIARYASTLGSIYQNSLPYRITQPEDVAAVVAWVCSDEAKYITGAQIPVDLGNLIR
ncbi:2-hydroxycyclohexanecarboxyl-CoA dehydrogenase [Rhodococcus opacus PD630]|uniref:mycofactocin-coupled SDR family oxidoreductase n=1 Tax=Rhodococcus opacus TaxID=37919 RepID=UPI00029CBF10|nr:mycofactocin-coupled SDR family oxidoreductase [Rhodococcus opacus]AHK29667.1 Putative short-chain type dehydrogenase/reductase [Rhodococcus opacus PD630]EHI45998.1 2-hydroxycyclohexanecarboxyl-CoA dehydrogenase [Rhodococcus opacus PD630]UDG99411.1 mycofactocin-coupled SDR family oxidoreductase [Rhodococcus opacus PD630]